MPVLSAWLGLSWPRDALCGAALGGAGQHGVSWHGMVCVGMVLVAWHSPERESCPAWRDVACSDMSCRGAITHVSLLPFIALMPWLPLPTMPTSPSRRIHAAADDGSSLSVPEVWFADRAASWHYLAGSFTGTPTTQHVMPTHCFAHVTSLMSLRNGSTALALSAMQTGAGRHLRTPIAVEIPLSQPS